VAAEAQETHHHIRVEQLPMAEVQENLMDLVMEQMELLTQAVAAVELEVKILVEQAELAVQE
tara:strand:- start:164 stop:349 length:186 start_codon:yes stop_codon:yes gene_type:complete